MTSRVSRQLGGMLALLSVVLLAATPLSASAVPAEKAPQLSIAVDDGQTSATAGDKLSYTLTVTNLGTERVRDLLVTQTVPSGSKLTSKDSDGTESKGTVTWKVDVDATKKVTLRSSLAVLATPADVLRLATVVCAKKTAKSTPIVCASDSNQLPAGAAAAQAKSGTSGRNGLLATPHLGWYVGGGLAVLAVLAAGVLLVRQRRGVPDGVSAARAQPLDG